MAKTIVQVEERQGEVFRVTYTESEAIKVNLLETEVDSVIRERIKSMLGSQDVSNMDRIELEKWFVENTSIFLASEVVKFLRDGGYLK